MSAAPTSDDAPAAGSLFSTEGTEQDQKRRSQGACYFSLLGLFSTAAFICGVYSYARCEFLSRKVVLSSDYSENDYVTACADLGYDAGGALSQVCQSLLQNHGIGFSYWQATVPVDQKVCFTYTQLTPWGYVTPTFDSNFNASQWFSIIGFVFGAAAWFTLSCSCLCRIDQTRLKGVACYFWIACFFQGMSLLMFRSTACDKGFFAKYFVPPSQMDNQTFVDLYNSVVEDVECSLSFGSEMAVSATVLYFLCLIMVPFAVVPWYEERQYESAYNDQDQQQQQQQQGQKQDGQNPQQVSSPTAQGQGPVAQGHNTENV